MAETGRSAAGISQDAVLHDLQQNIAHIRMRLFDLVKKNDAVGSPAHPFAQHSAVLKPYITGRRSNQLGDSVLFHELGHINAYQAVLVIKQVCRKGAGKGCLSDTSWPGE